MNVEAVSSNKEMRQLARKALARGWRIEASGGGHRKWRAPSGDTVVCPFSPSDRRGILNLKARMKRIDPGLFQALNG